MSRGNSETTFKIDPEFYSRNDAEYIAELITDHFAETGRDNVTGFEWSLSVTVTDTDTGGNS